MHIGYKFDDNLNVKKAEGIITVEAKVPKIVLVNKFTEGSAKEFRDDFSAAIDTGQDVIPVVIDSYGGYVDALLSMVDIVKSSTKPVITFATGKAMSCGAVLFTCGERRYIGNYTRLMIHDVASGSWGKVGKLKVSVKETKRLNKVIYDIMEKNIGKGKGYLGKIVEKKNREDWFLTAKQAVKHNIATDIGIPEIEVSISMSTSFK